MARALEMGDATLLRIRQEDLCIKRAAKLQNEIRDGMARNRTRYFLDMRHSARVEIEAIKAIAECAGECQRAGGWLVFVVGSREHLEAIESVGDNLPYVESIEEVGALLRQRQALQRGARQSR